MNRMGTHFPEVPGNGHVDEELFFITLARGRAAASVDSGQGFQVASIDGKGHISALEAFQR